MHPFYVRAARSYMEGYQEAALHCAAWLSADEGTPSRYLVKQAHAEAQKYARLLGMAQLMWAIAEEPLAWGLLDA